MLPAFLDVGLIGSPVDVATFMLVLVTFVYEVSPRQDTLAAAVVALAEEHRAVDDERLRSELEVDERDINAVRPTIADGDDNAGD